MQLTNGTELKRGDYRIIDVLGQGGFGITYLALQVKLNRKVAIKEFFMKDLCNRDDDGSHVSVGSAGSKDLVERFKQKFLKEAGLIASFDNANIIRIHDVFEENGTAYYVMEYLEGKSLKRLVDESGALPEDVAVKYIRQVAGALKEVHENNLLHLDVKPANIMLDKKGNAVLIDFGISKHYDEAGHQTSSAGVGISEGYAPIEQYEAGALKTFTPVTDIYALGATLFFLLTGTRPPKASYINDEGLPPMPETLSLTVRKAVESAMQPRRKDRPQSVKEFIALLENQDVIVGSEETEVASDATNLSMGTGQNASNGNAAVEENEIEVEVVETPSVAPEPAPRPQPEENQKKSKWLWIIILLAVICGAGISFYSFDTNNNSASDTKVNRVGYLNIKSNPSNAIVYVDSIKVGKTPLNNIELTQGHHQVTVCKPGYQQAEYTVNISDTESLDVNLNKYNYINYHPSEGVATVGLTEQYSNIGKYGLVDSNYNEILPCEYDDVVYNKGYAFLSKAGKSGIVDKNGKVVIPIEYTTKLLAVDALKYFVETGYVTVGKNNKNGVIDKNGNVVIPIEYDYARIPIDGYSVVRKNGRGGIVDLSGQVVVPCIYDEVYNFYEGRARVKMNGKYGFVDKEGNEVIPCTYEEARNFSESRACVKMNGYYGFIDKEGNEVIPCVYWDAHDFSEGLAPVRYYGGCKYFDRNGVEVIHLEQCKYARGFTDGMAIVTNKEGKDALIDKSGRVVLDFKYDEVCPFNEDGLAKVILQGKYGVINKKGNEITSCKYDYVEKVGEHYRVKLNEKWGWIDSKGKVLVPCISDECWTFNEGLAGVSQNGKYGFVNMLGEIVIPIKYSEIHSFGNGKALVELEGETFLIDKKGNRVE